LRATDNANPSNFADRAYTILIGSMMAIGIASKGAAMPPATLGVPYSFTFQVANGTPPYTFSTSPLSPAPPGLTLSPEGILSGIPTAIGDYSFTYEVTDANGDSTYLSPKSLNVLLPGALNPVTGTSTGFIQASLGAPYAAELDIAAIGGMLPFQWTVAPGSSLPPGISILSGTNGVSSYLAGVPTAAGSYTFILNVTDAAGQTGNTLGTLVVSPLATSPAIFPNGVVGSPYSATFNPSGGTPPYQFAVTTSSSFAPGLSLSSTGTLSGIPTAAGIFTTVVAITDSANKSLASTQVVVIDNATSQAQGIGLPDTVQLSISLSGAVPSPVPINVSATTGTIPFSAAVLGIPGATLSPAAGTAPAVLTLSLNPAGLKAGTYYGVLGVTAPSSTANLFGYTRVVLTVTN
jgi:hypothetical protein